MKFKSPILAILVLALIVGGLVYWWRYNDKYPATEDAYVQANVLTVSSQILGQVKALSTQENAEIAAGDVLLTLVDDELQSAVQAAQAQLDGAVQDLAVAKANVEAAQAQMAAANANLENAEEEFQRNQALFDKNEVAQSVLDSAKTTRDSASANVDAAKAALEAAQIQLGDDGTDTPAIRAARASLAQAKAELAHASISAPTGGWITNLTLREGDIVSPGQSLFSVIESDGWWVDANFKETALEHIQPGMPVTLSVDMYPGVKFSGKVDSIGRGSGAAFALLPPQNATGNWVKVTQRFTVRIAITEPPDPTTMPLRVGASVHARIDTTGTAK